MSDTPATDPTPRVVVYTTSWCSWCHRATELLARRGIAFEEIDGEVRWGGRFRHEIHRRTGGWTVPQVVIDGKPIGGYQDLALMDARGELDGLATQAPASR